MSAQDFLVELGTEELPPKALNTLADAFLAGIEKGLQTAGLKFEAKKVYAAPRRLAVLLTAAGNPAAGPQHQHRRPATPGRFRCRRQPDPGSPWFCQKMRR
jgi:glycyl-tRNA synthetase beta subunit